MFGPIGSDIMSIFRLLSPGEIDKYIEAKKVQKISGAMAASGESISFDEHEPHSSEKQFKKPNSESSHEAEVIPINDKVKVHSSGEQEKIDGEPSKKATGPTPVQNEFTQHKLVSPSIDKTNNSSPKSDLEKMGVLSASSLRLQELNRLEEELKGRDSTTAFLIKEREKMRKSKMRLVEQHAFKTYQKNANQEIVEANQDLDDEGEDVSNSTKGILVNKKHY